MNLIYHFLIFFVSFLILSITYKSGYGVGYGRGIDMCLKKLNDEMEKKLNNPSKD